MSAYKIKLTLKSPALIGSGVGFGALIDSDIVFDDLGIPYIPSRRIKGCLLDSAKEVEKMFELSKIKLATSVKATYGKQGAEQSNPVYFSNLYIEDYGNNRAWLGYFSKSEQFFNAVTKNQILDAFTEIRHQTAIDESGVAKKHSLRTVRLVKKGITFEGEVYIGLDVNEKTVVDTLVLSCANFRYFGAKRNRGFGEIECSLFQNNTKLSIQKSKLEAKCTN